MRSSTIIMIAVAAVFGLCHDRKLIGVLDVEVSYDVSMLAIELTRRFPASKLRVEPVNGGTFLSGIATDGIVLDQALTIARQFGPEMLEVTLRRGLAPGRPRTRLQWSVLPRQRHLNGPARLS